MIGLLPFTFSLFRERSLFIIWLGFVLCCIIRCGRPRFRENKY
jgi:hypothetical protein